MKNSIIITVILVLIVGAAAFFGGMKYQQSQGQSQDTQQNTNGTRRGGNGRLGQNGGNPIRGQISSVDNTGITINLADGSSKVVLLSSNTTISKSAVASKQDIQSGQQVMVFGAANPDGSVTAQSIQLNPQFRGGATPSAMPGQ